LGEWAVLQKALHLIRGYTELEGQKRIFHNLLHVFINEIAFNVQRMRIQYFTTKSAWNIGVRKSKLAMRIIDNANNE
jgi:hypothetical protein